MKVLILGGTGTMGRYLAQYVSADESNQVYITSRREMCSAVDNIHYIKGNAKELPFLQTLMQSYGQWDVIVDFMVYSLDEFKTRIDVLLSSVHQYFFLSSARVYASAEGKITEQSSRLLDVAKDEALLTSSNYAIAKAQEENLLFSRTEKNWTIVRPYITYSSTKLQLGVQEKEEWLYRALHNRSIVFSEDMIEKKTTMTFGKDAASAIYALCGKRKALGEVFNITYPEASSWSEILRIYQDCLQAAGYQGKIVYTPKASDISSNRSKAIYDRLYDRQFETYKISVYCDCKEFLSPESGIRESLECFLQNPQFGGINWITQAKLDRITNERAKWHEIAGLREKMRYFLVRYLITPEKYEKMIAR